MGFNQGEVEITLDGKTETLRCTPGALKAVNNACGSIGAAVGKIVDLDFNAYVAIIAAGIGKRREEVEDAVYRTGMGDLIEPLSKYIGFLTNGGRDPNEKKDASGSGEA